MAGGAAPAGLEAEEGVEAEDEAGAGAFFAAALLGLAEGIAGAEPAGLEEEEGAEAEDEAAPEGIPEIGTGVPLPPPATQPGTLSAAVALAGPSVTATQPGKFANKLPGSTFS